MADFLKKGVESLEEKVDEAVEYLRSVFSGDKENGFGPGKPPFPHKEYEYKYDTVIAPLPVLDTTDGLPPEQVPSAEWLMKVVKVAIGIVVNRLAWREGGETQYDKVQLDLSHLGLGKISGSAATVPDDVLEGLKKGKDVKKSAGMKELLLLSSTFLKQRIVGPLDILKTIEQGAENNPKGRPSSIEDYKGLFVTQPLPALSENYTDDAIFTDLRVAGYNPVVIERVSKLPDRLPVTDAMLAAATAKSDTLDRAGREGRLFLADYSALNEAKMGNYPNGPKCVSAPLALFALPSGTGTRKLVPVAIQCGQDPKEFPVHTPTEGTLWSRAKTIVQQADNNYHELVSHLAGCHLLMEPFAIATHNELARDDHPIGHLLTPHFEGTLAINDAALKELINPKGPVDQLVSSTIESSHNISVNTLLEENFFNKHMLPTDLKERGVMSEDLYYPYRDDALELWHAIQKWVRSYVAIFYPDDASVQKDSALQAWAKQLVADDGGCLKGFGEKDAKGMTVSGRLTTINYLVEALTMVIFTASANHATFNYAQLQYMPFAPAVPSAIYRSMPITERQASVMPELDHLPPLEMARLQMEILVLLGGVYHTRLGQYGEKWAQNDRVRSALAKFQEDLQKVSSIISGRNKSRNPMYTLLMPENIPQSINI